MQSCPCCPKRLTQYLSDPGDYRNCSKEGCTLPFRRNELVWGCGLHSFHKNCVFQDKTDKENQQSLCPQLPFGQQECPKDVSPKESEAAKELSAEDPKEMTKKRRRREKLRNNESKLPEIGTLRTLGEIMGTEILDVGYEFVDRQSARRALQEYNENFFTSFKLQSSSLDGLKAICPLPECPFRCIINSSVKGYKWRCMELVRHAPGCKKVKGCPNYTAHEVATALLAKDPELKTDMKSLSDSMRKYVMPLDRVKFSENCVKSMQRKIKSLRKKNNRGARGK